MTFNLLSQLMNQKAETSAAAKEAKSDLVENPEVVLEGVNAPEFGDSVPFDMEEQFASQPVTEIAIPQHNDGLDDEDPELTSAHSAAPTFQEREDSVPFDMDAQPDSQRVTEPERSEAAIVMNFEDTSDTEEIPVTATTLVSDVEPDAWNLKPFNSRYFNFGGRTVNSLTRAGYTCFDDIKGFAYSELKAIKGFGQGCLDEVLELLEAENAPDWLMKRKSRTSQATADLSVTEDSVSEVEDSVTAEPTAEVVAEPAVEVVAEPAAEVVVEPAVEVVAEPAVNVEPTVEATGTAEEQVLKVAPIATSPAAPEPAQESGGVAQTASSTTPLKILVIGGQASPMLGDLRVASFEQVYREAISMICQQANSPSLASIEFGKGWGALSATIRNNGWAQGVDVLTVSSSYMSRSEILMELRLLADLVIESA